MKSKLDKGEFYQYICNMPTIEVSTAISRPKSEVFALIKNMEGFPFYMSYVKNLKIIKRLSNNSFICLWEIDIEGAPVSWKEEVYFEDKEYQVKFRMVEGSYKDYHGYWQLEDALNGCKLSIKASYDWGIPILEAYVGAILEKKARRGLLGMLTAIKNKAEASNTDTNV